MNLALGLASLVLGAGILAEPPDPADATARYLFYLHGRIVQEQGRDAVSPEFGRYDYDGIVRGLAGSGAIVVSEVRPRGTDPSAYADRVAGQVRRLLKAGVPPGRITVIGASMGGHITKMISTRVTEPGIGYVLLGACDEEGAGAWKDLHGVVLSIFEASDTLAGGCASTFAAAPALERHAEVRLETGLGHGFLYRPLPEWMAPATRWARDRQAGPTKASR
jgi:dienelactone hydrolase